MMHRAADPLEAMTLAADGGQFGAGLTAMPVTREGFAGSVVDITAIETFRGISIDGDLLRIGSLTTLEALRRDETIARHMPELIALLPYVASVQVRNLATLGGNIGWGKGDLLPVLAARAARLRGPLLDIAVEDYQGGLIADIVVPLTNAVGVAEKVGHRAAFSPPLVTVAATFVLAHGSIGPCRLAIGGGEPVRRLFAAEAALAGKEPASIDWPTLRALIMEEAGSGHRGRVAARVLAHLLAEKLA